MASAGVLTYRDHRTIIDAYTEGASAGELAQQFRTTPGTIRNIIRNYFSRMDTLPTPVPSMPDTLPPGLPFENQPECVTRLNAAWLQTTQRLDAMREAAFAEQAAT